MTRLPDSFDAESLLRTALAAGRMNAYEWDVLSDRVHRVGDSSSFVGIPGLDLGDTASEFFALIHEDDRAAMKAALASLTPAAPDFAFEYRIVAGGRVRWIRDSARAQFDPSGAMICLRGVAADVTSRREAEDRLRLIAAVSELIGTSEDAARLLYLVARTVGEHLHARRCLFTEIDLENDRGIVRRDYCRGVPSVAGVYRVSDYSAVTRREMQGGRTVVNCDSQVDPRTAADYERTYAPNGERSYVAVPLLRDGRWVAEFWISDDVPRNWTDQEVALLETVAERAWTALEKLRVNAALRESEARMHFIGERAQVGYWYWDIPRDELIWSPVCHRLHGIAVDEPMTYDRYLQALHPDDRELVDQAIRSVVDKGGPTEYDVECRAVWPDGTVHWLQAKGSATFEHGSAVRMAGITLDVTERKRLEREREELLATERRLRARADEASLAKDHFLALLSHELRTPMTTILGWATFIRSGMADHATTASGLENIEQASRMQSRLIDDLLDVSRIVAGKMTLDRKILNITDAVLGAVEMVKTRASSVDIHVDAGSRPSFVNGDAIRLQQIVWNLLSNAVKFTPAGGRITITIAADDQSVEIVVRDTGIGIEPGFLPFVFERFRQFDDGVTRRFGGLGLGLSIVRYLTELHGGSVTAYSEGPGRGAEFRVRLPTDVSHAAARQGGPLPAVVNARALAGLRIVLVDDDPAAREVMRTILSAYGAQVRTAAGAAEAFALIESEPPDVLVSDIAMPDEDGYSLMRRVRGRLADLPGIAVTAFADGRDRDRALAAGYRAHLTKPVEPAALASAVLDALH